MISPRTLVASDISRRPRTLWTCSRPTGDWIRPLRWWNSTGELVLLYHLPQELVSFPDPTNPSADRFQYRARWRTFITPFMFGWNVQYYGISRANKQRHLDLAQGLALFVLIRPYLKSFCLPAPSVAAATLQSGRVTSCACWISVVFAVRFQGCSVLSRVLFYVLVSLLGLRSSSRTTFRTQCHVN